MIACVSPSYSDAGETISTLRYAVRTTKIKQVPVVKIDPRELLILSLRREIRLLSMENSYLRQKINIPISTNLVNELMPKMEKQKRENRTEGEKSIETLLKSKKESIIKQQVNEEELKNPDHIVAKYMQENKDLRTENAQLHLQSQQLREDLEMISRENERLKKKCITDLSTSSLSKVNSFITDASKLSNNSSSKNEITKENHHNDSNKNLTFKIRKNSVYNIKQSTSNDKTIRRPSNLPVSNVNNLSKGLELRGISAISHSKIRNSKG